MGEIEPGVEGRIRATNAARAQFLASAFALTFVVSGVADFASMHTLRHHGFMLAQLLTCLAIVAVVRWTAFGQRHGGPAICVGIAIVSMFGAAHVSQFGGFDGPWFYGSYTAPPIFIPILLTTAARTAVTFGTTAGFVGVYAWCRPDLFSHPMAHIPLVYLATVSAISVGIGRYVYRLERASFADLARLEGAIRELEKRMRADADRPAEVRREVARQLHDEVAQLITGARIHLDSWADRRPRDETVVRLGEVLDELGERSRRMLKDLRDPPERGSLDVELERLRTGAAELGLAVDVLVADDLQAVDAAQVEVIASVAREALTNAARHARARQATVSVFPGEIGVSMHVLDDGGGRVSSIREGNGLRGIRERVEALGGRVALTDHDGGLCVGIELPRARAA